MPVGDVMNEMKAVAGELCEEVHLFDIYRGVPIQPGEKSVALSITLRAADRTLGEEEITAISEKIIANVSAKIRRAVAFLMQTGYNKGNESAKAHGRDEGWTKTKGGRDGAWPGIYARGRGACGRYMQRVAGYVDRRMSEISYASYLPEDRLMALTALNLADELLKVRMKSRPCAAK